MTDKLENIEKKSGKWKTELKKEVIQYVVAAISEFAKRNYLTFKEATNYLLDFKGIAFLEECYAAEHTLSVNDWVDDVTAVCKRNGGGIG